MFDAKSISEKAKADTKKAVDFLSEIVQIESFDNQEKKAAERVVQEMQVCGFDKIYVDPMGNVIGSMGTGDTVIAFDGHIDVVGVGDLSQWTSHPFSGDVHDGRLWGRGSADQKSGVAAMIYAAKNMKELGMLDGLTILVVASVNEEDCDGLCWQYLYKEQKLRPEFVVLTEPSDRNIYRGQKGRMALKISTKGISAHGSVPEKGENAIYKMAPIILDIEKLNKELPYHAELGWGTITISQIYFSSASSCAVADGCSIILDRRLTYGETKEQVINQLLELESVKESKALVEIIQYNIPTYTGLIYPTECHFPSWITSEDAPCVKSAIQAYRILFEEDPKVDKWVFSTNGVAISGLFGVPCIGYGPGDASEAHKANESVRISDITDAIAMYMFIPQIYLESKIKY
jgi:putative selenium metabolism hydrolase